MNKSVFSKDDTLAIKGIAIILMMLHHCFLKADRFKGFIVSFAPIGKSRGIEIAIYGKICVGMFVFLSSYGLTLIIKKISENNSFNLKNIGKYYLSRYISVISGYFFIVITSFIVTQILDGRFMNVFFKGKNYAKGIGNVIITMLGIQEWFGQRSFCGTWWYMGLAIIIVLLTPVFYALVKKSRWFYPVIGIFLIFFVRLSDNEAYYKMTRWLLTSLTGIGFADFDIFRKIKESSLLSGPLYKKILIFLIETAVILATAVFYDHLSSERYDLFLTDTLSADNYSELRYAVCPVLFICYCYQYVIGIKYVRQTLIYLGRHSANIFLIHTFIRAHYLKGLIYGCRHFILIITALLTISLVLSIIIEWLKKITGYHEYTVQLKKMVLK